LDDISTLVIYNSNNELHIQLHHSLLEKSISQAQDKLVDIVAETLFPSLLEMANYETLTLLRKKCLLAMFLQG
jgi:hypothetical protein